MKDVLALAFGTMIGWGWIMLAGSWVGNGGSIGAMIAFGFGGVMAMLVALFFLWLYLPGLGSPAPLTGIEWGLCGGWIVLGIIFFIVNKASRNGKAKAEEIEYLMFGNEYKRF